MIPPPTGRLTSTDAIVIRRPNDWVGRFRHLKVFVAGAEIVRLRPNETFTMEVQVGHPDFTLTASGECRLS
jgi:hypothetical protein